MKRNLGLGYLACLSLWVCAHASLAAPLLLVSVDGLHPSYVTQAQRHGLEIPNLRRFVSEGARQGLRKWLSAERTD